MLLLQQLKTDQASVVAALAKRNLDADPLVEDVLALDERRRALQTELDQNAARANQLAKSIGQLFQSGKAAEAEALKAETAQLKEQNRYIQQEMETCAQSLQDKLYLLPNTPHHSVPKGKSAEDNETVFEAGNIPQLHENAMPHWDLAKKYDLIDFELGVKIAGAGFPVYKGKGGALAARPHPILPRL